MKFVPEVWILGAVLERETIEGRLFYTTDQDKYRYRIITSTLEEKSV